jgi:hypothetical protein
MATAVRRAATGVALAAEVNRWSAPAPLLTQAQALANLRGHREPSDRTVATLTRRMAA